MIEYRITKANDKILHEMWKNNRQLITISDNKFYFSKEVKKTKSSIKGKETKERKEFIEYYRKHITNKWSYAEPLIRKYELHLKDIDHDKIMQNLKDYKLFLEVNKTRSPLQAPSYLNSKRFLDDWEIIEDKSRKFIEDICKELNLTALEIDNLNSEIDSYEKKHNREVSDYNVRSLIHYIRTWKPL